METRASSRTTPALLWVRDLLKFTHLVASHFEKAVSGTDLALRLFANQDDVKKIYSAHEINYVVFMGSLQSAHDVYTDVAENDFIDVQLDLGGKDGAYIAPDCD